MSQPKSRAVHDRTVPGKGGTVDYSYQPEERRGYFRAHYAYPDNGVSADGYVFLRFSVTDKGAAEIYDIYAMKKGAVTLAVPQPMLYKYRIPEAMERVFKGTRQFLTGAGTTSDVGKAIFEYYAKRAREGAAQPRLEWGVAETPAPELAGIGPGKDAKPKYDFEHPLP